MLVLVFARPGLALPAAEVSLTNCQKALKSAGVKYVKARTKAIAACLSKLAEEKLRKNHVDADAAANAANTCAKNLRRVNPLSLNPLAASFQFAVQKKCEFGSSVTHTFNDILGPGATVAEPLQGVNLGTQCAHFGGDGVIDNLYEWIPNLSNPSGCSWAVYDCASNLSISVQYPRAIEWLDIVRPAILALPPPPDDLTKYTEAVAGLDAVKNALEGTVIDGVPDFQCGDP